MDGPVVDGPGAEIMTEASQTFTGGFAKNDGVRQKNSRSASAGGVANRERRQSAAGAEGTRITAATPVASGLRQNRPIGQLSERTVERAGSG